MRILLIQCYLGRREKPIYPLGLVCLAGSLDGHEVSILDPNVEDEPFDSISRELLNFEPEVVGISLRNIDTTMYKDMFNYYKMVRPTLEIIKKLRPASYIIIGGTAFSLYAEEIMLRNPEIDFGIYLEGEATLLELVDNLSNPGAVKGIYYRQEGKLLFSGSRQPCDLGNSSAVRWDLLALDKYHYPEAVGVQSKRGCCLNCAYCTYPFLAGHKLRLRVPEKVVDEIEQLVEEYGAREFMFNDSIFNLPKWHAEQICEDVIRRGIQSRWSAYFSLKDVDENFIRLAHRAGCYLFYFSPDGYSQESLNILRKEVGKKEVKQVYNMVRKLKLEGANFDFSFFINPPGQNYLSLWALIWLLVKTNFILPRRKFMHISVNVPRFEPHTELYELAVREGTLSATADLLPYDEGALPSLFYHNPNCRSTEKIYGLLLKVKNALKKPAFVETWR